MKKQFLGLVTIMTIFSACQKNEVSVSVSESDIIHATIEDKDITRTVMDESNNVLWSENDQIIAFLKSSFGHKYQVKPSFIGKSHAEFSMVSSSGSNDLFAGNEWEHNVAYYPYSEDIECLKSGSNYALEVNLPSEQLYAPDSFANGSMAMVAVSENNNITFKNVLGGIKLQLKGTQKVTSIKIEGNNNEKLSGAATVMAYTDENKPVITMASTASTSVTLNCSEGVQLNEDMATEFIIALPPVLFSKGFTVTMTDSSGETHTVGTDKPNTILRSSILTMPAFTLGEKPESGEDNDETYIKYIYLDKTSLTMYPATSYTFDADIIPVEVPYPTLTWSSSDNRVATVDQNGKVTTISDGIATITALAVGGVNATCRVTVKSATSKEVINYIVGGKDYGPGIKIGQTIWAPVNCGYEPDNGDYKGYPYGKLYQWGRKYGQGYSVQSDYEPDIANGPVQISEGMKETNANIFYKSDEESDNWSIVLDKNLWNSNTESAPLKTEQDPCPSGWRVPTDNELEILSSNRSLWETNNLDQNGRFFTGEYSYIETFPRIFLPAAGCRHISGGASERGFSGYYWTSSTHSDVRALALSLTSSYVSGPGAYEYGRGCSIRCVQE